MLHDDIVFLKKTFRDALTVVAADEFYSGLLKRKFSHSWRVLQNGRAIMTADILQLDTEPELKRLCEQALLLHDVGRFEETVITYKDQAMQAWGKKYDHGAIGAELLSENPLYNDNRVVLAVRHHGHMIESFYDDDVYQNLPPLQQRQAEMIVKLVRDADKLDLYYLQKEENNIESDPFFCSLAEELKYAPISPAVKEQFVNRQPIRHSTIKSLSDRILGCLSWEFDFNYPLTAKLYHGKGYKEMLLQLLYKYCPDKDFVSSI